jgi:hypothetical protein
VELAVVIIKPGSPSNRTSFKAGWSMAKLAWPSRSFAGSTPKSLV